MKKKNTLKKTLTKNKTQKNNKDVYINIFNYDRKLFWFKNGYW